MDNQYICHLLDLPGACQDKLIIAEIFTYWGDRVQLLSIFYTIAEVVNNLHETGQLHSCRVEQF